MPVRSLWCAILLLSGYGHGAWAGPVTPAFTIADSLSINRVLEPPQVTADGSAIAYVLGNWQDGVSIRAHKPLGRLIIWSPVSGGAVTLAESASDPVWSRSGKSIAFFAGLGEARALVIAPFPPDSGVAVRLPAVGERSRYSARHFAPVWSRDDRYVVIAEARIQPQTVPRGEPYSLSAQTQRLPDDAHFRDDTLWRLVRFDPVTRQRQIISADIALRELYPAPDGARLALAVARQGAPGKFLGDSYVQPMDYLTVSTGVGSSVRPIALEGIDIESVLGWRDGAAIIARTATGLVAVDLDAATTDRVLASSALPPARDLALSTSHLAVWGPAADEARDAYVIAPPAPEELSVVDLRRGVLEKILTAADRQEVVQSVWLPPGERLVVHTRSLESLAEQILLWSGGTVRTLLETDQAIGPIAANGVADRLVFSAQSATAPPELFTLDVRDSTFESITRHNAHLAEQDFVAATMVAGSGANGTAWRGLLYLPGNAQSPATAALVVRAYGRQTQQRYQFNAEAQMHVARGYAYLLPDVFPRRGRLREAYAEVLPAAVTQVRRDFGLGGKTGFLGGSLGGYAGLVLLTHSQIAAAAVLRAAPAEFALSWATGKDRDADLLEYLMLGERPDQNPTAYAQDSPFWMADRITAPTLFLHGSEDEQVPLAHSQWMFQSLRRLGKAPTELRVYPGADHSIVRGNAAYYTDFYQQIFRWWARYLDPKPGPQHTSANDLE